MTTQFNPGSVLYYVGLESYKSRYSYQLTEWNERQFKRLNVSYRIVKPQYVDTDLVNGTINVGQVLDAAGRSHYALGQIQTLLSLLSKGVITGRDVIFFEDMFHPGLESLAYYFDQLDSDRPRIFIRCLAQTIDPDDFVNHNQMGWMRHFEKMAISFIDGLFVASHEMLGYMTAAGWDIPVCVTGLPFNSEEVRERASPRPWAARKDRVVFAARVDWEKQPEFFLEVAKEIRCIRGCDVEFMIVSGKPLTSNSETALNMIRQAEADGIITVREDLDKNQYYQILAESKVLFNCALQDWVSNTVSEADALGANVVYPAYRSFVETFKSDETRLYVPWSVEDACNKLEAALEAPHVHQGRICAMQNRTIAATLNAIYHGDAYDDGELVDVGATGIWVNPLVTRSYRAQFNRYDWATN